MRLAIRSVISINIFCTKVFCPAFLCLELVFVIFWQKEIGKKLLLKYRCNGVNVIRWLFIIYKFTYSYKKYNKIQYLRIFPYLFVVYEIRLKIQLKNDSLAIHGVIHSTLTERIYFNYESLRGANTPISIFNHLWINLLLFYLWNYFMYNIVKLVYNDHSYNEFMAIKNRIY